VELILNESLVYQSGRGYLDTDGLFLIDKSCAGLNFLLISFCVVYFSFIEKLNNVKHTAIVLLSATLGGYLITIIANTSRITVLLWISEYAPTFNPLKNALVHEWAGIFVYFSFLLLYYIGVRWCLKPNQDSQSAKL
jgi:exosortase K